MAPCYMINADARSGGSGVMGQNPLPIAIQRSARRCLRRVWKRNLRYDPDSETMDNPAMTERDPGDAGSVCCHASRSGRWKLARKRKRGNSRDFRLEAKQAARQRFTIPLIGVKTVTGGGDVKVGQIPSAEGDRGDLADRQ